MENSDSGEDTHPSEIIDDGAKEHFEQRVTDFKNKVLVKYNGILPDLFREGQGVVIRGHLEKDFFVAEEVLAKHDETYMPPEVQESLGLTEDSKSKTMESISQ